MTTKTDKLKLIGTANIGDLIEAFKEYLDDADTEDVCAILGYASGTKIFTVPDSDDNETVIVYHDGEKYAGLFDGQVTTMKEWLEDAEPGMDMESIDEFLKLAGEAGYEAFYRNVKETGSMWVADMYVIDPADVSGAYYFSIKCDEFNGTVVEEVGQYGWKDEYKKAMKKGGLVQTDGMKKLWEDNK